MIEMEETREPSLREYLVLKGLTHREAEVVEMVYRGLTSPEIGAKLFICEKTVKFHLTRVYKKLGYETARRLRLIRLCMTHGLRDELVTELNEERRKSEALAKENQILRDKIVSSILPRGNL